MLNNVKTKNGYLTEEKSGRIVMDFFGLMHDMLRKMSATLMWESLLQ